MLGPKPPAPATRVELIGPRRTRLLRAPTLQSFQRAIGLVTRQLDPWRACRTAVIVPTHGAAEQLRRALEELMFHGESRAPVLVLPRLVTRDEWYRSLHGPLPKALPFLSPVERQVCAQAAAQEAASEAPPPFRLRPGFVPALLDFYDELMRHRRSVDDFERLLVEELEPSVDLDRGARRLLRQTRFLAAMFRAYRRRVERAGCLDEHGVRELLVTGEHPSAFSQVVITVADWATGPTGLWPADFDLLTRLRGLEQIDVVATEATLGAGFGERLGELLPGIEEECLEETGTRPPIIVTPAETPERHYFVWRDREEELLAIVRALKGRAGATETETEIQSSGDAFDQTIGVVFRRPLPYLYLAGHVFGSSGVPFETSHALPLAAEPYAASVEAVCTVIISEYSRRSVIALLRSPHFTFTHGGRALKPAAVHALDRSLLAARYKGGRETLAGLADQWNETARNVPGLDRPAVAVAAQLAEELRSLEDLAPASAHLDTLLSFLRSHAAAGDVYQVHADRASRAREAIWTAIEESKRAHERFDDRPIDFAGAIGMVRRWIEKQTFASVSGTSGVQLIDAEAAAYGCFDRLFLVGLADGEWPERTGRNIFYPTSLLGLLGWPRERERIRSERARVADLLRLPLDRVALSTFILEDDVVVTPSSLLEDVADTDLVTMRVPLHTGFRVSSDEALLHEPIRTDVFSGPAAGWLELRRSRSSGDAPRFHGVVGLQPPATYAVSNLEEYLNCPFKYFAGGLLALEEERTEERTWTPEQRGLFLHRVFESFFRRWQANGDRAITPVTLERALETFSAVVDEMLAELPPADRTVTRVWLLGSAAASGLAERLFRFEVDRPGELIERLMEFKIDGVFDFGGHDRHRRVRIRGVADRVDLLADGTFQLFDYKSNRAPNRERALQLPVYARCVEQQLDGRHERQWMAGDAAYIAFGEPRLRVTLAKKDLEASLDDGERRLLDVLDGVEQGIYPPRPAELYHCAFCPYSTVCRKDYVGEE